MDTATTTRQMATSIERDGYKSDRCIGYIYFFFSQVGGYYFRLIMNINWRYFFLAGVVSTIWPCLQRWPFLANNQFHMLMSPNPSLFCIKLQAIVYSIQQSFNGNRVAMDDTISLTINLSTQHLKNKQNLTLFQHKRIWVGRKSIAIKVHSINDVNRLPSISMSTKSE